MRRALAVALIALAACSNPTGGTSGPGTATTRSTPTSTTPPDRGDRVGYLTSLDLGDGTVNLAAEVGEDRAYALGLIACEQLDAGSGLTAIYERMGQEPEFTIGNQPTSLAMPATIVAAAIYLCPEHMAVIEAAMDR